MQSFDVAADPRGLIYSANLAGMLVYDGAWWRKVEIGAAKSAMALSIDPAGRVCVGGIDDLGVAAPADEGALRFRSLAELLPPADRHFGQIVQVLSTSTGCIYLAERWLVAWDGSELRSLATFPAGPPYPQMFRIDDDEIDVWNRDGLHRLAATGLAPLPGGERFRDRRIDALLPAADGALLVSVRGEGLFLFRDGAATPFAPEASRWAVEHRVYSSLRLPDGGWALGSILGGVLLLRPDGTVDAVIDSAVGLPDDLVHGMTVDREGVLWLALNRDLAKVEVASPLSVIDRRSGLVGSVYAVTRYRGSLWAGTAAGLFTDARGVAAGPLEPGTAPPWGRTPRMRPIAGLPPSVWSLLPAGDDLLVGTTSGVFQVSGGALPQEVPGVDPLTAYTLAPSPADPDRTWVGLEDGVVVLRRRGGRWVGEGRLADLTSPVRSIVEGDGVLWLGTEIDGVVGIALPPAGATAAGGVPTAAGASDRPPSRVLAPGESIGLFRIGGRILATRERRIQRLDEAAGALVDDPELSRVEPSGEPTFLAQDADGNLWLNTRPPSVAPWAGEAWSPVQRSLVEIRARSIEEIFADADGTVWLAGDDGLYAYAGGLRARERLPAPLVVSAKVDQGPPLFNGVLGTPPPPRSLGPGVRRLQVAFAPLSFRDGLRYQTRLDPVDDEWSPPSDRPVADLTRPPPDDYTLRVRTVGPDHEIGPETAWSFRVPPPWYRTWWALVCGLLLAVFAVHAYAGLRSRAQQLRAARLEARVSEQTVELQRMVDALRRTQSELQAAAARLEELSLQDELTGVANRRRLDAAMEAEWSRAQRRQRPLALILLDLDHFKRINDSRGHLAGDEGLRMVARSLAALIQRRGDLLARYGGDEFAVLLPETDLQGARQVAERLRERLESLALPDDVPLEGRFTASFGVTAVTPLTGQRPEVLIDAADRALYRAKLEGRNRVLTGGSGEDLAEVGPVPS